MRTLALLAWLALSGTAWADRDAGPEPLPEDEATLDSCLETRRIEAWGECAGTVAQPCLEISEREDWAGCHGREHEAWAALLELRLWPALERVAEAREAEVAADVNAMVGLPSALEAEAEAWEAYRMALCQVTGFEGEAGGVFEVEEAACFAEQTAARAVRIARLIQSFGGF